MKNSLLNIIENYGIKHQLKKLNEEIFELNEAIINAENNRLIGICRKPSEIAIQHIAEEIADCYVMLEQFRLYYDIKIENVKNIMEYKINRQMKRMEQIK